MTFDGLLRVGTRIKLMNADRYCAAVVEGSTGTIRVCNDDMYLRFNEKCRGYGIEFDEPFSGGHTCNDTIPNRQGHWIHEDDVEEIIMMSKEEIEAYWAKYGEVKR